MADEDAKTGPDVSLRVKVIKTDMEETMRDTLMLTVCEVFDKAKEKTTTNKDIIYKDIATGIEPGGKSRPSTRGRHVCNPICAQCACAGARLQPR